MRRFDMTLSRWQTVSQIFGAALDLPANERDIFICEACAGDAELQSEVNRLLAADGKAGSFLEHPALSTLPARTQLAAAPLLRAETLVAGRFQIVRFIGQGGMGQVYEALDLELNSRIALKAIRPEIASDPRMLSRFRREVQLTRMITHPNVCRTFDIERHVLAAGESGMDGGDLTFLTMELLEGETLSVRLRRMGRLTPAEALPLVLQMIDALAAAHAVGVIHRDFKPSNVLLVPGVPVKTTPASTGGSSRAQLNRSGVSSRATRVVVTDFGLARALAAETQASGPVARASAATSLTGDQTLMGTPVYMAPEQFERGEASIASDIYSLGLVMFEMITGQRPFADDIPFAEATKRLKHPAPLASAIAAGLEPSWDLAISQSLALDPQDRFESAHQVREMLTDSALIPIRRPLVREHKSKRLRLPLKILMALAILAVVMSLSFAVFRLIQWRFQSSHLAAGANVLITDMANVTADSELNGTTDLLRNDLSQSTFMNLLEPMRVKEALARMKKPKETALDPSLAREVAWRTGVPLVIFGTISRVAEDYKLDLKAEMIGSDPLRPKSSWAFSETAPSKKDFFEVVRRGGTWVRKLAGETENQIGIADRNLDDVTTTSWEALKLYSDGERMAFLDKDDEAILFYKRAVEKDPNFAMAWMRLGDTLDTQGRSGEGFGCWRTALAVSGDRRLTPREELRIKGMYANDSGDLKAAIDYFSQYSLAYPNDYLGYFYRGVPLMLMGRTEEAIQVLDEAEKRAPDVYYIADHLARYNLILGNTSEVIRYTTKVRQLGHRDWADEVDGLDAVVAGDFDRAQKLFAGLDKTNDTFLKSLQPYIQASALAEQGRSEEAISRLDDGARADQLVGNMSNLADKLLGIAHLYFQVGKQVQGRENALNAIQAESSAGRLADAGTMLARAGFVSDAARLKERIDIHAPEVATRAARLRLDGEILLAQNKCPQAFESFQQAKDEDQETALLRDYWEHALLRCGRRQEAVDELKRMRSRPGQAWHQPEFYPPGTALALVRDAYAAGS
jgi:serine/threonine protein kinase/tetratricopeptide (TPR) repeat protein